MTMEKHELEKRIAMLERKVLRQIKAREQAEQQLETFSWEIFKKNSSLSLSLEAAQRRARELAFLHEVSLRIANENSMELMISSILKTLVSFSNADYATTLRLHRGKCSNLTSLAVYSIQHGWMEHNPLIEVISKHFDSSIEKEEEWLSTAFSFGSDGITHHCIYIAFPTGEHAHMVLILIHKQKALSSESLYVLNTAKRQLQTGIRRRINEARLNRYTLKLESVLKSLRETQEQLIQSEKMASLGQLAAGVAHEINNPLGFVRSNLQVLKEYIDEFSEFEEQLHTMIDSNNLSSSVLTALLDKTDLSFLFDDAKKIIDTNLDGIQRVSEIVQSLKNVSRVNEETFETIALNEVIDNSLKVVRNELKYQHEVINKVDHKIPTIEGNFSQLQQVFINLFVNAAQAMPDGGTLVIDKTIDETTIDIYVIDSGIGMDDETKRKVFTPFFTTKPVGIGTGIGMSISYAILEKHNTDISIESTLGEGTTFKLTFPLLTTSN